MAGRMSRPASGDPRMVMVPAASIRPVTTAALAARTAVRRGVARQDGADHAGAVFAAGREHGHDGDDRLAGIDPGEAGLGGVHLAGSTGMAGWIAKRRPGQPQQITARRRRVTTRTCGGSPVLARGVRAGCRWRCLAAAHRSCSGSPPTVPPVIWLAAVFSLRMRPPSTPATTRVARTSPRSGSIPTSANLGLEDARLRRRGRRGGRSRRQRAAQCTSSRARQAPDPPPRDQRPSPRPGPRHRQVPSARGAWTAHLTPGRRGRGSGSRPTAGRRGPHGPSPPPGPGRGQERPRNWHGARARARPLLPTTPV